MPSRSRRDFLGRSALAAGAAVLAGGLTRAATVGASAGTASQTNDPLPPTGQFLDAVMRGDRATVERLLAADPGLLYSRDGEGRSAFALAQIHGRIEIAGLLRERGYAPDLHESALALDWDRFEALAAATPGVVNQDHPIGGTAMYAAAVGGAGSQTWRVYRYAGDPNARPRGERSSTALCAALEYEDLGVAELTAASMLSNGTDPNQPRPDGRTPLHIAAERGSIDVVEILLRKGADRNAKDEAGNSPTDLARARNRVEVLAVMQRDFPLEHSTSRTAYDVNGAPYREPDISVFAPVTREDFVGASHGNFDYVREEVARHPLLAHSVAMTTERAVEACAHTGRLPIVDFLLENGAPYSLPTAIVRGDLVRAAALLDEDPLRIQERGAHDFALLWYTVIGSGGIEAARFLLDRGAEIEDQHFLGTTVLHYAAIGAPIEMVDFLIEHGADVNRMARKFGGEGKTPLQLALAREREDVAKLLRDRGATG